MSTCSHSEVKIALFALEAWRSSRTSSGNASTPITHSYYAGQCEAYAEVLERVTGIAVGLGCEDEWQRWIETQAVAVVRACCI